MDCCSDIDIVNVEADTEAIHPTVYQEFFFLNTKIFWSDYFYIISWSVSGVEVCPAGPKLSGGNLTKFYSKPCIYVGYVGYVPLPLQDFSM